jgi:hypothetical protein
MAQSAAGVPVVVLTRDNAIWHLATVTVAATVATVPGLPSAVHNTVIMAKARLGRQG